MISALLALLDVVGRVICITTPDSTGTRAVTVCSGIIRLYCSVLYSPVVGETDLPERTWADHGDGPVGPHEKVFLWGSFRLRRSKALRHNHEGARGESVILVGESRRHTSSSPQAPTTPSSPSTATCTSCFLANCDTPSPFSVRGRVDV